MKCIRCGSQRVVKFVDAFGTPRVFCRDCFFNISLESFKKLVMQRNLLEFSYLRQLAWRQK